MKSITQESFNQVSAGSGSPVPCYKVAWINQVYDNKGKCFDIKIIDYCDPSMADDFYIYNEAGKCVDHYEVLVPR
jgi:hypothetical protein